MTTNVTGALVFMVINVFLFWIVYAVLVKLFGKFLRKYWFIVPVTLVMSEYWLRYPFINDDDVIVRDFFGFGMYLYVWMNVSVWVRFKSDKCIDSEIEYVLNTMK